MIIIIYMLSLIFLVFVYFLIYINSLFNSETTLLQNDFNIPLIQKILKIPKKIILKQYRSKNHTMFLRKIYCKFNKTITKIFRCWILQINSCFYQSIAYSNIIIGINCYFESLKFIWWLFSFLKTIIIGILLLISNFCVWKTKFYYTKKP